MVMNSEEIRGRAAGGATSPRPPVMPTVPRGAIVSGSVAAGARPSWAFALARLVWLAVGVVDAILALDFVFRLIGSIDTGFVHGIYVVGSRIASPFVGIFAGVAPHSRYTLTWSDLVAVGVCTVAGWIVVRVILMLAPAPPRVV